MPRVPFSRALIATLAAIVISIPGAAPGQATGESPPAAARTVWDGVYNAMQAVRGQTSYTVHCANCHGDDLTGYDGLLRGQRFMRTSIEPVGPSTPVGTSPACGP